MVQRLVSWNVNGVRSCVKKGFVDWLAGVDADVVGLQETRAELADVPGSLREQPSFPHLVWSSARSKKGYSGVALLLREEPLAVVQDLGVEEYDREGRFLMVELPKLLVANVYFPNGSGDKRDNGRVPYKLAFTRHLFRFVEAERKARGKPALIMGDFNVAPEPIDLARPKANEKTSGFLPEERAAFAECLKLGYVDSFRALHADQVRYSWWSNRIGVREKNIGWRIDHVVVRKELLPAVHDAFIWDQVQGSDHCPIGVDLRYS